MSVQKGDYVLIDYVGREKETGRIFGLTLEEVARKEKVYTEDGNYNPELVIIGEGFVVEGLDDALIGTDVGDSSSVELSPEKAFGKRDISKIESFPVKKLQKSGVRPQRGARVHVGGRIGTVLFVGQGRARIDFNHPLAEKIVVFDYTVRERLEDDETKIKALISRRMPKIPSKDIKIDLDKGEVQIELPEIVLFSEGIGYGLTLIAGTIQRYLEIPRVTIKFVYFTEPPQKTDEEASEEE